MFFNENSALVQLYVKKIREGTMQKEDVPNLFNLREVVFEILDEQQDIDATVGNVHQLRTGKIALGEYSNIVPVALKDAVLGDLNAMGLYGYGNPIVMEQENQGG